MSSGGLTARAASDSREDGGAHQHLLRPSSLSALRLSWSDTTVYLRNSNREEGGASPGKMLVCYRKPVDQTYYSNRSNDKY